QADRPCARNAAEQGGRDACAQARQSAAVILADEQRFGRLSGKMFSRWRVAMRRPSCWEEDPASEHWLISDEDQAGAAECAGSLRLLDALAHAAQGVG